MAREVSGSRTGAGVRGAARGRGETVAVPTAVAVVEVGPGTATAGWVVGHDVVSEGDVLAVIG